MPPSPAEIALKHRIDEIYTEHPFYGSRKIVVALQPDFNVNRKAVQRHQGERAQTLLLQAGIPSEISARVGTLVAKAASKGDLEAQALEDAACLTFLATELGDFATQHPDYTREKFIDIIRKTWRKMSPDGHRLALTIPLAPALKELVVAAISG